MHSALRAALDDLGAGRPFLHVDDSYQLSEERIDLARRRLTVSGNDALDVVAFGSLARREMTQESDFDYLVLVKDLPPDLMRVRELLRAADELRKEFTIGEGRTDREVPKPGVSGLFGRAVGAFDLIETIGLQEDTNHSLTRRMLLLEESVSLMNPDVHKAAVLAAINRYLSVAPPKEGQPPRFLLNDVIRYWRTITVDYQAKALGSNDEKSILRYLKLIISRKILFAGTVMSLLRCGMHEGPRADADSLLEQFTMPPLARLLAGHTQAPRLVRDAMAAVITIVDRFLALSGNSAWRERLSETTWTERASAQEFNDAKELAKDLQRQLNIIFFEWNELAVRSREYLVF
ncbi:nucleotidyltransferase domain-containing protein [Nakamurella silvestris]|nr:nucleotidyltransferase domain-containing protein [Nakamurella silvestris]